MTDQCPAPRTLPFADSCNAYSSSVRSRCIALLAAIVLAGCATPNGPTPLQKARSGYDMDGSPASSMSIAPSSTPASGAASVSAAASEPVQVDGASARGEIVQSTPKPDTRPVTAPVPTDPLQPDVQINLDDATARADLWTRLRRGFAIPDLESDIVRDREQWYSTRPDYVQRMTERSSRYLFHIVEEVERRGMPTELALLPYIESAFNPQALSTAQASGMWQFIPSTGKDFELKQNMFRDDRRDVLASTRAALDYLARLHDQFGDWHLALAAYNWGEGSVQRAMARNVRLGLPTNYEALNMPNETRYYVPKLQAVKNIIARPEQYGIALPALDNHPYFLTVPIERDIDVSLVMRFAGMQADEFRTLNPQLNKPVILASGTPQVLLPYDNASLFVRNMAEHRGSLATWTAWTAPRTLRPSDAAELVGMDEATLREINRIPSRMLIKQGSTLLVRRSGNLQGDVSGHVADNAVMTLAPDTPPLTRVSFKAGRGDSVASIARRYGVTAAQAAQWNNVQPGAAFKPGQMIVVYTARPNAVQGSRTSVVSTSPGKSTASELRKAAADAAAAEAEADKATAAARAARVAANSKPATPIKTQAGAKNSSNPADAKTTTAKATQGTQKTAKGRLVKAGATETAASHAANSRTRVAQNGGSAARP